MITGNPPEILSRLEGVRKTAGGWQARCPAHDDQTASLSVSIGDDGRVLLHDHAGCEPAAVVRALGIELKDLMPSNGHANAGKFQIDREYDYRDETGELLYQAVRLVPKDFRQRRRDDKGGWTYKVKGVRLVPYNLPAIKAAAPGSTVFGPEGEKDGDRLTTLGLLSTCSVGGAGKWRDEYSDHFTGLHFVVLADNDDAGRKHAQQVAASVYGKAASVKVIEFEGLPEKADVSDWLDAGHTVQDLHQLVEAAPEWKPTGKAKQKKTRTPITITAESLDLQSAAARTDVANARRFALCCRENVRWCDPWSKWLVWDDRRWSTDAEKRIDAMAKQVADAVWLEVATLLPNVDFATAKELTSFARSTASARGISNMLSLAKSEPGIPILPDTMNAEPWLLNVANGTVDLKTGELRPHAQADYLTTLCPTPYDPAATFDRWHVAVSTILDGKRELIGFVQRLLGSALVGTVVEHILPILWGDGSNGKGLFLETIMDALGQDFACKISSEVLMASKGDRHPTELADLHGKRLVVASETDDGRRLREGLLKEITGGDTIKARRMREDFWQYRPSHTLFLLTNHKPIVRGNDHGVWRRLCLVPFTQKFWDADRGETGSPDLKADKHLRDHLAAEHSGILAWLVQGCLAWQANGLGQPAEVTTATAEYRSSQDVVGVFLAECCIEGNAFTAKASTVYACYLAWCKSTGEHPLNQRRFGDALSERGIDRYKSNGVWYSGLGLALEQSEQLEQSF